MSNLAPGESAEFDAPVEATAVIVTAKCSKCGRGLKFHYQIDELPQLCKTTCECGTEYEFKLSKKYV